MTEQRRQPWATTAGSWPNFRTTRLHDRDGTLIEERTELVDPDPDDRYVSAGMCNCRRPFHSHEWATFVLAATRPTAGAP